MPSSRHSKKTASCSGAGWTGRFGLEKYLLPWPCPLTCRLTRWAHKMIRRPSSTSLKRLQRHVGGPRRTGQCASFRCSQVRHRWRHSSCQFRTSWSTTTSNEPSMSALQIAGAGGKRSIISSTTWCWTNSLRSCRRLRSGTSATA